MRATARFLLTAVPIVLAFSLLCSIEVIAQQQVYHGDGASNNGSGSWSNGSARNDQCLSCHMASGFAQDESSYLLTGHKNMLRKITAGQPWTSADGSYYSAIDDYYKSGSLYDWMKGTVTVGGPGGLDSAGAYPYYTTTRNLFYMFGGWSDGRQVNTIFVGGFTGREYPNGTYDCARCHTTGYRFDASGTEPTYQGAKIPDAQFSRVPTSFAPSTGHTSSWSLDAIQCERCHVADNGIHSHVTSGTLFPDVPSIPVTQTATALCLECHREEKADTTLNTITPTVLTVTDHGSCWDGVSPDYATCVNSGYPWNYEPHFDYGSGPTFLNGPHARFAGTITQNAQNSTDLSVSVTGTYNSAFTDRGTGLNSGCVGCHNVHVSTVAGASPGVKDCGSCHNLAQNILATAAQGGIKHPKGPGTPFPTGTSADLPGACITCHMSQNYHLFRISVDDNYSTFPTPDQLYDPTNPQTAPNTASDGKLSNAVWSDVDLACGQCHTGGDGYTNPYGLMGNAFGFTKQELALLATGMHSSDASAPAAKPTFTPGAGAYNVAQTVKLADTTPGATMYYTIDGSTPTSASLKYTLAGIKVSRTTRINAIAFASGYFPSAVSSGQYSIVAAAPTITPKSGIYYAAQSVSLSTSSTGASIYYTTDGATPTTASTKYTAPFAVTATETVRAIAAGTSGTTTYDPSATITASYTLQAATPTMAPGSGTYNAAQTVTISTITAGLPIYYTLDGTFPTTNSSSCSNPCTVKVSASGSLQAIAAGTAGGTTFAPSGRASATYYIMALPPTFVPPSGTYKGAQTVTITTPTIGASIYYTTDGSAPSTSSTLCVSPCAITVPTSERVQAIAAGTVNGTTYAPSARAAATYTIN